MLHEEDLVIDTHDLCKAFNHKMAVDHVGLHVKKGEIFGFLGPNGGGKTTTIRMICGILNPDSGSGHCLGYDIIRESEQIKKRIGYMTQNFSLYLDLTARENLNFVGQVYGIKASELRKTIDQTLKELDFDPSQEKKLTRHLSGGWRQRIALAAAILHRPQLLLLDEPTAGIDPKARRDFWDHIHHMSEQGVTTLISTHYMDEADHCHRLAYISNGRLLAHDPAETIIQKAHLTVWNIEGPDLNALAKKLRPLQGITQATLLGNKLHVSGPDATLLDQITKPFRVAPYVWTLGNASLEDVFIYLTTQDIPQFNEISNHYE